MSRSPDDLAPLSSLILKKFAKRGTASIDDQTSLVKSGWVDSFGIVELVSFLEAEYGVTLPDGEVVPENFETLAAIRAMLRRCT
jgi:acyl carrier protein